MTFDPSEWCESLRRHQIEDLSIPSLLFSGVTNHDPSVWSFIKKLWIPWDNVRHVTTKAEMIEWCQQLPPLPRLKWLYFEMRGGMKFLSEDLPMPIPGIGSSRVIPTESLKAPQIEFCMKVASSIWIQRLPLLSHVILAKDPQDHYVVKRGGQGPSVLRFDKLPDSEEYDGMSKTLLRERFHELRRLFDTTPWARDW